MDGDPGLDMRDPPGGNGAAARTRYIHLDPATFSDQAPQKMAHALVGHPLMTLESFVALARRRPPNRVRIYNAAKVTAGDDLETVADRHGSRTFDEMMRDIEQNKTYLFIQNVEQDDTYAPLARELLEDVKISLRARGRKMVAGWAWVFISAPNTVTPYHRDHEQTCLLQLSGRKTLSVWRPDDREVCGEDENEFFHTHSSLKKTIFQERFQPRAQTFELTPGEGIYMPFTAPHWVQNGPETSVSFSVTYQTEDTRQVEATYRMNALLRRVGLQPAPVGLSAVRDELKHQAWRVVDRARSVVRSRKPSSASRY
jgi:hypothetical protein